jgi:hypothetical protein
MRTPYDFLNAINGTFEPCYQRLVYDVCAIDKPVDRIGPSSPRGALVNGRFADTVLTRQPLRRFPPADVPAEDFIPSLNG